MKEEEGGGREDMARKSFETFDGKLLIRRSSHCSLNLLFLIILRFPVFWITMSKRVYLAEDARAG